MIAQKWATNCRFYVQCLVFAKKLDIGGFHVETEKFRLTLQSNLSLTTLAFKTNTTAHLLSTKRIKKVSQRVLLRRANF